MINPAKLFAIEIRHIHVRNVTWNAPGVMVARSAIVASPPHLCPPMCLGYVRGGDRRRRRSRDTDSRSHQPVQFCRTSTMRIHLNRSKPNEPQPHCTIAILCLVFTVILAACGGAPAAAPTAAPPRPAAAPTRSFAVPTAVPISQPTKPVAQPPAAPSRPRPPSRQGAGQTLNGVTLPADAAPADQQVYVVHYDNTADFTTIDFTSSIHKRGGAVADILSDALVRIDKNFQISLGRGHQMGGRSSGLVWTFTPT